MSQLLPSIDHIVDAEAQSMLERLEGSVLVEGGQISLIGLNSIKARLGARWPGRADQVHEHVHRSLSRFLGDSGYFVRISQTDYLVVQPGRSRYGCQASCLTFMRDLLRHFLGEAAAADIEVREVTTLARNRVEAKLIDPTDERANGLEEEPKAPMEAMSASPDRWSPFVSTEGRNIQVSCALEPVFTLKNMQQVGYRLTRRVIDGSSKVVLNREEQSRLNAADIEQIDCAAIARGMSRLNNGAALKTPPMLLLPVSYSTLSTRRGHAAIFAFLKEAGAETTTRALCEIKNIEGVPIAALFNMVAVLRRACYAVIGRLEDRPAKTSELFKTAGFNGLAFKYRGPRDEDLPMVAALSPDVTAMAAVARSSMVLGLRAPREIALAKLVGATHASMRVIS